MHVVLQIPFLSSTAIGNWQRLKVNTNSKQGERSAWMNWLKDRLLN